MKRVFELENIASCSPERDIRFGRPFGYVTMEGDYKTRTLVGHLTNPVVSKINESVFNPDDDFSSMGANNENIDFTVKHANESKYTTNPGYLRK